MLDWIHHKFLKLTMLRYIRITLRENTKAYCRKLGKCMAGIVCRITMCENVKACFSQCMAVFYYSFTIRGHAKACFHKPYKCIPGFS